MQRSYLDIAYGPYERNTLDIYLADSDRPTPLWLFFHGGGYIHGDKAVIGQNRFAALKADCLAAGISVASANYRFISTEPFPAPMNDGTRAIQFIRHMAEPWNIDPERIAVGGESAGAHISLWNAFKGDLASTDSDDPVARQSSAVSAVVALESQITKDQQFYTEHCVGTRLQPNTALFYGIADAAELDRPDIRALAREASAINFLSTAAPPVLVQYNRKFTPVPIEEHIDIGHVIHHPIHGYVLQQQMDRLGLTCIFRHPDDPLRENEIVDFLVRY